MATIFEWTDFGDFIFSVIIVGLLIFLNFEFISLVVSWGAALLTHVVRNFILAAVWLSKLLGHVSTLVYTIRKFSRNKSFAWMAISGGQPGHAMSAMSALVDWYLPYDRPVLTIIRTSITFIGYMALRTFILSPMHASYVMMRDTIEDIVPDPQPYSFDAQEDIHHLTGLALFIPFIVLLATSRLFEGSPETLASDIQSQPSTTTETKAKELQEQLQPTRKIDQRLERHLETLLRYLDEGLQKNLAAKGSSIRRVQELEAQLEKEKAARLEAQEAQSRALTDKDNLRSQLVVARAQLRAERNSHSNVTAAENKRMKEYNQRCNDKAFELRRDYEERLLGKAEEINDLNTQITKIEQRSEKVQPEQALLDKVAELDEKVLVANREIVNASQSKLELSVALDQKNKELGNLERRIYAERRDSNQQLEIENKNEKLAIAKGRIEYLKLNLDIIGEGAKIESDNELFADDPAEESKHVKDLVVERISMENRIRELEAGLEGKQKEADELQDENTALRMENDGLHDAIENDDTRHNAELEGKQDEINFLEGKVRYYEASLDPKLTKGEAFEKAFDGRQYYIRTLEAQLQYFEAQKKIENERVQAAANALTNGRNPFAPVTTAQQGTEQKRSAQDMDGMVAEQGIYPSTVNGQVGSDTSFPSFQTQGTQNSATGYSNASTLPPQGMQGQFVYDVSGIDFGFHNSQVMEEVQQQAELGHQPEAIVAHQWVDEEILRAIDEQVANKPDMRTFVTEADQAQQQSEQEAPSDSQAEVQLEFQPVTQPEIDLESHQEPEQQAQQHSYPIWPLYRRDDEHEESEEE
ncbi:hypothetical protein BDW69DRAFT_184614 [Aspergillus filifer]